MRALQPLVGNRAVLRAYSHATEPARRAAPVVTQVRGYQETVQRGYEEVLEGEGKARARKMFGIAVIARRERDQLLERIRYAQREQPRNEERLREFTARKDAAAERLGHAFQVLNVWHMAAAGGKQLAHDDLVFDGLIDDHPLLGTLMTGASMTFVQEGKRQFDRASKQVELLLGNRREVAETGEAAKFLDTRIWSWGVNQAFVEGGAKKGARFVVHTEIGDAAPLLARPRITGPQFLAEIRPTEERPDGLHRNLWHSGEGRPTWYALELAGLLDMGYRLVDRTMMPPARMGPISRETGDVGKTTYLITEGLVKQLA